MSPARKYAAAMHEVECGCVLDHCIDDGLRMAEACLPVADAEQAETARMNIRLQGDIERLWAERDALRAQVEAVRALADEDTHHLRSGVVGMVRLSDLRAALSSSEPVTACSTCGQSLSSPGCCVTPDRGAAHMIAGGCDAGGEP